ncbi:MAG: hypothetical protein ACLGHR_12255, partial [Gammaproteobacteria bacterium]
AFEVVPGRRHRHIASGSTLPLERRMWEIYAYQNADSLFGIFNAAAAIHGSGDYMAAVAAVAFCGFIASLVAYAFGPSSGKPP